MDKLLLIDGNALMHRAYHAIPPLTTAKGEKVNAIFGFTSLFLRALADLKPAYAAFTFDVSGPTFRHLRYDAYKATRQKMEQDLADQIPRLKELVTAFGLPIYELKGFEADDLIGTLAREAFDQTKDLETYIMTADMDAAQLVNQRTSIYTAKQKISEVVTYTEAGIVEKYGGLDPSQIVDYKALRGDTSDNIPGVPGIGEKTAIDLLNQYKSLNNIYDNVDKLKDRTKELLNKGKESAYLSKELATIDTHAPIKLDLKDCHLDQFDSDKVKKLFQELEFRSLLNRLPANSTLVASTSGPSEQVDLFASDGPKPAVDTDYHLVKTADELKSLITEIVKAKEVAIDTECTSLDIWNGQIVGVSCSYKSGQGYYIPVADWSKPLLTEMLENASIFKIAHHAKFDIQVLHQAGIKVTNLTFDTMLAAYLLKEGSGRYGLKELAFNELGIEATPISDLIGTGAKQIDISQVDPDRVAAYASADADHTWQLYQKYQAQFKDRPELFKLFSEIEMPVSHVLSQMEETGILVNKKLLLDMSVRLGQQLKDLEKQIFAAVGHEFNINSPKQLADILFDELNLPTNKKTKTGRSTDESVLLGLKDAHPAVELVLQYRELYKLKSTYVDALPTLISQHDGRLHTSYGQAIAATGRLSSSNPNLQNIPIRTEAGRAIRCAFIANPGHQLLSIDYSQIELRLLAHVSHDQALLDAFKSDQDVHTATAAKVFDCPLDQVTKDQRRAAKTINFGIMYGQSAHGLAMQLGITREAAATFITDYFNVYTGVKDYLKQALVDAHKNGYVEDLFGRRRRIPELTSSNFQLRQAGERMAINMPIQGSAADIIKKAMVEIQSLLNDQKTKTQMLLQVHDELVFTLDPAEKDDLLPQIVRHMESAIKLDIPLKVEAKIGPNWGEMEEQE